MKPLRLSVLLVLAACTADTDLDPRDDGSDSPVDSETGTTSTADTGSETVSCFASPPTLEIGTGEDAFEPLSELTPVEVVFGSQGGYHMLAAVRVCHMDPVVTVHVRLVDEATSTVVSDQYYLAPTFDEGGCCRYRADMYGYLDVSAVPGAAGMGAGPYLHDKVVVYELEVEDDLGNVVSDSVRVLGQFP